MLVTFIIPLDERQYERKMDIPLQPFPGLVVGLKVDGTEEYPFVVSSMTYSELNEEVRVVLGAFSVQYIKSVRGCLASPREGKDWQIASGW